MKKIALTAAVLSLSLAGIASASKSSEIGTLHSLPTLGTLNVSTGTTSPSNGLEAVLFNSGGFESYTLGNLGGQNGWIVDNGSTTQYTVVNTVAAAGTQSANVTGGVTNWAFPDVSYTPAVGEGVSVSFDIARTVAGTGSFGYAIDVYPIGSFNRVTRVGLVNNAGVVQAFVTSRFDGTNFNPASAITNVLISGALSQNTFYNFDLRMNFATDTLDIYSGASLIVANVPFANVASAISDADFQVSSAAGATDQGWLDNYVVQTYAIPEPATLGLLAGVGLVALRRKSR